ncbi:phenylalanine--tRNA ligase subunit beta [Buchnera aphidicola]|uniref:phenylalanine--tRNA ligase subunit beta n=1 Tax=Buchnera aphidicola TaxID=9 RepID=UPI0031B88853
MKVSEQCIRNWISVPLSIEHICQQLTYSGLEVEEIKYPKFDFSKFIIGKIIHCMQHPNKSDFFIFMVNIGMNKNIRIVHNHKIKKNKKVVIALPESKLLNHKFVKLVNIFGVLSEGIFCKFLHVNIFIGDDNIIQLPDDAPIGIDFRKYYFCQNIILKVNVTPNRLDALGALGIAREVSILNNLPLPQIKKTDILNNSFDEFNINMKNINIIFSLLGVVVNKINLKFSTPDWIQLYLRRFNISPVNIIIDIFNYVFLKFGHSLYIFSSSEDINNISICYANNGDFLEYNKKKIFLNSKMLIIKSDKKIISYLGNIDYDFLPCNTNHENLFIGSFFIEPEVLNNSIYHFKKKKSIFFNEYFVNPYDQEFVINYVANLFIKICHGNIKSPVKIVQSKRYNNFINRKIKLFYEDINSIVGYNIDINIIHSILKQLHYHVVYKNRFWILTPPVWRIDIFIKEDIISDILRIYNYNNIPEKILTSKFFISEDNILHSSLKRVKYTLIDSGYHEVINYSFVDPGIQNIIYKHVDCISLINPISKELSCMRFSLIPGLLKMLLYHQNRQYEEVRFFESGLCFIKNNHYHLGVEQNLYLSGIIGNINYKNHWDGNEKRFDFYDIKGDVESIFSSIGYLQDISFKKKNMSYLKKGSSAEIIFHNCVIGYVGALNPYLLQQFDLTYSVFLFELYWHKINFQNIQCIKKISDFPSSKRDLSIIVSNNILVGDLIAACKKEFVEYISEIYIYDIYRGNNIPTGKKSVTFTIIFQSVNKTLEEKEINFMIDVCMKLLKKKFSAILRN